MIVPPPRYSADHPARSIHCVEALEAAFAQLEQAAVDAGWEADEALIAIMDLAKNSFLAQRENLLTEASIAASKRLDDIARGRV